MKRNEINIRDPFVLPFEGRYYLYGTRGATTFTDHADGFDVYVSSDLENWEGPFEIFHRPENFWSDRNFWAPEVHIYKDRFYMFATFGDGVRLGTASLTASSPCGPFVPLSDGTLTSKDWRCLDGTLYVSPRGEPYLVFCHEWTQVRDGEICAIPLLPDLSGPAGKPKLLFHASEGAPLIRPHRGDNWVTDGPFLLRTGDGRLHLLWSSFGEGGYVQAMAHSDTDDMDGRFTVDDRLLFESDGGHGMIFRDFSGRYFLTLHSPNKTLAERPVFLALAYENETFRVL